MPPFKDEHVLVIAPGSQTTLAQLGLPESFTPARLRVPTRMFPAEKDGEWEPLKIREKRQARNGNTGRTKLLDEEDVSVKDAHPAADNQEASTNVDEEEVIYEEDPTSDEGAVYPIRDGKIVNWSCFFALLTHVYNTLSPPFHTPIITISQPAWTLQDHENLAQFFFEKFKTPAFCLIDSAMAVCYAYAASTATIIDVGYNKCDVTAVRDFLVNETGRGVAIPKCGGEAMTQRLLGLLEVKGFNRDMCEQLKKNAICEVLPPGTAQPKKAALDETNTSPAVATSAEATAPSEDKRDGVAIQGAAPQVPIADVEVGVAEQDKAAQNEDDEGILDVASIVASGRTSEFLAQKEKEKAAKTAARKAAITEAAAAAKQTKLPNSQRLKASFYYHERKALEELAGNNGLKLDAEPEGLTNNKPQGGELPASDAIEDGEAASAVARKEERKEERRRHREGTAYIRKEIEVGPERFEAANGGLLDRIADAVHRCILSVPEINKRSELWDSLIIVGNGSKIRGFKESLLATLNAQYLISPSSATIFSSELPSNFTTPVATGANTPQPQAHHPQSHHGPGVNPLLLAATTASNASLAPPGQVPQAQQQLQQQQAQQQQSHQHGHSQTPTSIKFLKAPEYFPEWKEYGMEEACFLGAQVAAKVIFVVDQGLSKGYMSRTEYNDLGPQGIHESCM